MFGRKIYLASSWRNQQQQELVSVLRRSGHEVYDFKNPRPGDTGFGWKEIDGGWQSWDAKQFREALDHPIARAGFASDFGAMEWADTGVLLLPCGRSAHLEAGWFVGNDRPLFILLAGENEPELMYSMARRICLDYSELLYYLAIPE